MITTTIPTYNNATFILETLKSLAAQTRRPDRVIVLDDGSTDQTREIVETFQGIRCECIRNSGQPGLFENFNRCLEFAQTTEFLHILHADDTIQPGFYETMTRHFANCSGLGMGWCLDERMDEHGHHLSLSGVENGAVEFLSRNGFLKRKAELGNQAFCATLLKTNYQPAPCAFPLDYPIVGDMVFWAEFGAHCVQIFHLHQALANYRWHGTNQTIVRGPMIQALIHDEWRAMQTIEALREEKSCHRNLKLKGLMAVRSGIKAKRLCQNGNQQYSAEITQAARDITGWPLWLAGKILVELRDFYLFKIQRRTRHPKNIYG